MAAPTVPTLSTLVDEALNQAGHSSPTSDQQTRGEDQFIEEIKADISILARDLTSLYTTAYALTTIGKNRYANPTDYGVKMTMVLLHGQNTGTAQDGAVGSVTLASSETISSDFIIGKNILITAETGAGSYSQCTAYDISTKVATVTPDFTTAPAASSTYMIIDVEYEVQEAPVWDLDRGRNSIQKGIPRWFFPIGDANDGEFILDVTPDRVYGIQMRYYADLQEIDLAGTLMATLYAKWRNLWIKGVYAKQLDFDDDDRADRAEAKYENYLNGLVQRERYGFNMSNLNMHLDDGRGFGGF